LRNVELPKEIGSENRRGDVRGDRGCLAERTGIPELQSFTIPAEKPGAEFCPHTLDIDAILGSEPMANEEGDGGRSLENYKKIKFSRSAPGFF